MRKEREGKQGWASGRNDLASFIESKDILHRVHFHPAPIFKCYHILSASHYEMTTSLNPKSNRGKKCTTTHKLLRRRKNHVSSLSKKEKKSSSMYVCTHTHFTRSAFTFFLQNQHTPQVCHNLFPINPTFIPIQIVLWRLEVPLCKKRRESYFFIFYEKKLEKDCKMKNQQEKL